jgi:NAD(P)-dependent dehydrogenase (short-subunit alcohol dehydrogenase family)
MLGEAGATVLFGPQRGGQPRRNRPETIEQTAEMVTAAGGRGIAVQTDHLQADQVERLFSRVKQESGRLDILVNDIWGGDDLTEWGVPFWKLDPVKGFAILESAIKTHILTSRYGVPLMVEQKSGLVVEITDGDHTGYRGVLYYDLAKMAAIRLAYDMSEELTSKGVTSLAVTPGFLRSEAMPSASASPRPTGATPRCRASKRRRRPASWAARCRARRRPNVAPQDGRRPRELDAVGRVRLRRRRRRTPTEPLCSSEPPRF